MKVLALAAMLALVAGPVYAQISDVDHPDIPNCTVLGSNAEDCETLTMQAVYPSNGLKSSVFCSVVCGEEVCERREY